MIRYRLILEYDGGPFAGWQRQANGRSVQAAVEDAVRRLTGEETVAHAAGRTDAGVHAEAMPIHVDLARDLTPERLAGGLNHFLRPLPVAVLEAGRAPPGFHARFSATLRRYRYRILNRRAPPALLRGRVWHVAKPLACEPMHAAAQALVGRHDFTSFRASSCQAADPVKTLHRLAVHRSGDLIEVHAAARSFLHHQVRNLVGTLKLIGEGREGAGYAAEALAAKDRARAGPTAPAGGLCFLGADYPGGWP